MAQHSLHQVLLLATTVWLVFCCSTAYGDCDYELTLAKRDSTFVVSGEANVSFLTGLEIAPKKKNQAVSLVGGVVLTSREGCKGELKRVRHIRDGELKLVPDGLKLFVNGGGDLGTLADMTFNSVKMELKTLKLRRKKEGDLEGIFEMKIVSGEVLYEASDVLGIKVPPGTMSLVNRTSVETLPVIVKKVDSNVVMELPEAKFEFEFSFDTGIDLVPEIDLSLTLDGEIVAKGENDLIVEEDVSSDKDLEKVVDEVDDKALVDEGSVSRAKDNAALDVATVESQSKTCDFVYGAQSVSKSYTCDLEGTNYEGLIGKVLTVSCNTQSPKDTTLVLPEDDSVGTVQNLIGSSPFCEVGIAFGGKIPLDCKAWGCTFGKGSTSVKCQEMVCECVGACPPEVDTFVDGVSTVGFACDPSKSECKLNLGGGLPLELIAGCNVVECEESLAIDPLAARDDGKKWKMNWKLFVMSLPVVIVLIIIILLGGPAGLLAFRVRTLIRSGKPLGVSPRRVEGVFGIRDIEFNDIVCSVPISTSAWQKRRDRKKKREQYDEDTLERNEDKKVVLHQELECLKDQGSNNKSILHGVSGAFKCGEVIGIMGPSGSGKTTFLSVISNMALDTSGQLEVKGHILVNGRKPGSWMNAMSAFVPQEDKLLPTFTVQESLMYSALLRLPGSDVYTIQSRALAVMNELRLDSVRNSYVGGVRTLRGISGGERRRVTIGMELITDPSLVILDEPLSGLDSFTALNLMYTLKRISSAGRLVVLSIHQPTLEMLNLLDQLLLLANGYQVYLGSPQNAPAFFAEHGYTCPEGTNIAEYMLQTVSSKTSLISLLNAVHEQKSSRTTTEEEEIYDRTAGFEPLNIETVAHETSFRKPSSLFALRVLTWRGMLDIVRNPSLLLSQNLMAVLMGLWCGVVFFDAVLDQNGAQNRLGGIFFLLAFLAFSSLTTIDLLHTERGIVMRELKSGYYGSTAYVTAKLFLDAGLLRILPGILFSFPLYLMMGMQQDIGKFAMFIVTVCAFNIVVGALSMAITVWAPSPGTASLVINTLLLISLLMMGHLVHLPSIPAVVRWMHYASPFSYAFYILAVNEMADLKLTFSVEGFNSVGGVSGEVFLKTVGMELGRTWICICVLNLVYLFSVVNVFFAVWLSKNEARGRKFMKGTLSFCGL